MVSLLLTEEYKLKTVLKEFSPVRSGEGPWALVGDVVVTGGSRLVTKNDQAFMPILQNQRMWSELKRYKLQEEAQVNFRIDYMNKKVFLRPQKVSGTFVEKCFSALSPFSTSWVHWLFEVYPQLVQLSKRSDKNEIRILVEENAPAQIYETIMWLFPAENIVKLSFQQAISCQNLLVYTALDQGWSLLWGRNVEDRLVEQYHHNIDALKEIRDIMYAKFSITKEQGPQENIFIRRKAQFRFIHNEQELADNLFAKGFKAIEPTSMGFREQVECFSRTKTIVAQAGASLANVIFMRPGSSVICLAADSSFLNYDYFRSVAKELGISFDYVLGKVDNEKKYSYMMQLSVYHPLNASFTIVKEDLNKALLERVPNI